MAGFIVEYPDGAADNLRWAQFTPRDGDVIISSPPKAGTTLTQMLCALLVFGDEFPGALDEFSPWFDQITRSSDEALAIVDGQTHRRILKTHTPLDGIPAFDGVTFVSVHRDPRDVFVSWIHHAANINPARLREAIDEAGYLDRLLANRQQQPDSWDERFALWLSLGWEHSVFSLARIARHASVATDRADNHNVHVVHFADLRSDPASGLAGLATAMDIDITSAESRRLAHAAGIDQMRARAELLAPVTKGQLSDPSRFFRSGSGGEWRDLVSAESLAAYDQQMDQLVTPETRTWLERA